VVVDIRGRVLLAFGVEVTKGALLASGVEVAGTALLANGVVMLLLASEEHFSGFFWQSMSPGIGSENASCPHASIMIATNLRDILREERVMELLYVVIGR
jgi:hypothetical protein